MAIDQETLNLASDEKFTDFSKAVKQELNNKLSNHKVSKKYVSDFDKIQDMKKTFAKITNANDEQEEESEEE